MKLTLKTLTVFFIIIFATIALYIGPGNILGRQISHDLPYGYYASDAFWLESYAQSIQDLGHYKTYSSSLDAGFNNIIANNPPMLYHLAVIFSNSANIELYDSIIFITLLFSIIAILALFALIYQYSKNLAYLSIPLSLFIYFKEFTARFTFGIWTFSISNLFLIFFLLIFFNKDIKNKSILLAIFLASAFLSYVPMAIFIVMFLIIYYSIKFLFKNLKFEEIKTITKTGILTVILTSYYLYIFLFTLYPSQTYHFSVLKAVDYGGIVSGNLASIGIIFTIIAIFGFVFFTFNLKKLHDTPLLPLLIFFLFGFTNLIGFEKRGLYIRYLWPIFLSIGFGFMIYFIINRYKGKHKSLFTLSISLVLIILITTLNYQPINSNGTMDTNHWNAINHLKQNTEKDSKVLFVGRFYYAQGIMSQADRDSYMFVYEDQKMINELQNNQLQDTHLMESLRENLAFLPYKKSFLKFGYHGKEEDKKQFYVRNESFNNFNYILVDKYGYFDAEQTYNILILNTLFFNNSYEVVYENDINVILKNPGEIDESVFPQ